MPKLDKSQYSKSQWHLLKEQQRLNKEKKKQSININPSVRAEPVQVQTVNSIETSGIAFVLGNGTSRKNITLSNLKTHGTVYGCNALYREFDPDYLIAVDTKMILEIVKTGYHLRKPVWTNFNRSYSSYTALNFFEPSKGWSSGPTALNMASEKNYTTIYILGFDYIGLGELVNNIYAGTNNYKKVDERATYYGNWLRQTQIVIKNNPHITYIRVVDSNEFIPKEFANLTNLTHIKVEEFIEKFNLS